MRECFCLSKELDAVRRRSTRLRQLGEKVRDKFV